ncbi:MAG: DUF5686 family protein [Porphyromonas sp.]|nr:DUF5686 family protein [Porphyromonas sp.]
MPEKAVASSSYLHKDREEAFCLADTISIIHGRAGVWKTPDVIVTAKRGKYKAKDNPAVVLLDSIQSRHKQRLLLLDDSIRLYSTKRYENLTLCLSNFNLNNKLMNKALPFFQKYVESSVFDNSHILPLSVRESVTAVGVDFRKSKKNEVVLYRNTLGVDQDIDDGTMTKSLDEMFPDVDIHGSYIKLLNNRFVSPIGSKGTKAYKYYITDSLLNEQGDSLRVLSFYPFTPQAFNFTGSVIVNTSKDFTIERCELQVPDYINLNFVEKLRIEIDYMQLNNGLIVPKTENMYSQMSLFHRLLKVYSIHNRMYDSYAWNPPDSLVVKAPSRYIDLSNTNTLTADSTYTADRRLLSTNEGLKSFLDEMKEIPFYRFVFGTIDTFASDYLRTRYQKETLFGGSKFNFGPLSSFVSTNAIEGLRLRIGGQTTGYLFSNFFLDGFVAYGFKDKQFKYSVSSSYSFTDKKYNLNEFPKHDITITSELDLHTPGQIYSSSSKDNLLNSLGSSYLTNRSYRNAAKVTYRKDWFSGLSLRAEWTKVKDTPTGTYRYLKILPDSTLEIVPHIQDVKLGIHLKYAPGSKVYEGASKNPEKVRISMDIPEILFSHETAIPRLGGEYYYNRSEIALQQNLWIGRFGNIDYKIGGGIIWNHVPFPMLFSPPANSSFELYSHAFQLMRPLEYVADQYASLFMSYHMKGLLLNKIPLIKELKMREVLIFNAMYGNTSRRNHPKYSSEIFITPPETTPMSHKWYAECGVGLENILRILRFDFYYRITPSRFKGYQEFGFKMKLQWEF